MAAKKYLKEKLSDLVIRQAQPRESNYWLDDGASLRLLVQKNGTKCWRFNYRYEQKQKTLAIGIYPSISLKQARQMLVSAKKLLATGIDPSQQKKREKRQNIQGSQTHFEVLAKDWWEHQRGTWSDDHAQRVWVRLKNNTSSSIGFVDINDLHPQDVIAVVRSIEKRGAPDVAQRVLQDIRRICRYAVQTGSLKANPFTELTSEILQGRKTSHQPSLPRSELPTFLKLLSSYHQQGRLITQLAVELLVHTFVRPGELRGALWKEFDLDNQLWRIPAERMKMKSDHIVPLSRQAIEVLRQIAPISSQYEFVFPSERRRTECMSDNTMRRAIFKLGYDGNTSGKSKCVPHGFRATASSILNETGFNPDAIERQLSHMERNGVRAAYTHHARYLDERKTMMQWWSDYLDELKNSGKVIPIFSKQVSD